LEGHLLRLPCHGPSRRHRRPLLQYHQLLRLRRSNVFQEKWSKTFKTAIIEHCIGVSCLSRGHDNVNGFYGVLGGEVLPRLRRI